MNLIILISILSLAVLILALIKLNRRRLPISESNPAKIPQFEGLFAEQREAEARLLEKIEADQRRAEERERMIQRASEGDRQVLDEAHQQADVVFYNEVLNRLVERSSEDDKELSAIAEYLVESRFLRSTAGFNQKIRERWGDSLNSQSLYRLLYLSALSNDAGDFVKALETALNQWRRGRLQAVSGEEFLAMVESCYWLIASEIRASGSGFVIKRAIVELHRELAAATGSRLE
jgi:hypothetical protein